ncbi:response regulator [Oceanibacterium hippocampi]|uniref:Two-component response regulator n=1 Tax=Oceanibacterium hippocampi TaxID=745714 RepID=A0A1Y5TF45_9PROT|nr:response regulator [Oceanibacterium hippocampi]SLN62436.1 two-component response regulator [Oceanibacterium hippocampi]
MEKRAERLQVMLTQSEVLAVDDWRFEHKMPSRSAAVRALMNIGLSTAGSVDGEKLMQNNISSTDIGVVKNGSAVVREALRLGDGATILIVDQDFLIAHGIKSVLEDAGFDVLEPVATTEEALKSVEQFEPDAVILDLHAGECPVVDIADALAEAKVPFIFCTDCDPQDALPERHWVAPIVSKVSIPTTLVTAVRDLVE